MTEVNALQSLKYLLFVSLGKTFADPRCRVSGRTHSADVTKLQYQWLEHNRGFFLFHEQSECKLSEVGSEILYFGDVSSVLGVRSQREGEQGKGGHTPSFFEDTARNLCHRLPSHPLAGPRTRGYA